MGKLSEKDIQIKEVKGFFVYRINNILVEGFKTEEEALKHAKEKIKQLNKYTS